MFATGFLVIDLMTEFNIIKHHKKTQQFFCIWLHAILHGELLDYFSEIPQSHEITVLPDGGNKLELPALSVEEKGDLKLV